MRPVGNIVHIMVYVAWNIFFCVFISCSFLSFDRYCDCKLLYSSSSFYAHVM